MNKALGCTLLSVTLAGGLGMPAAALPAANRPGSTDSSTTQVVAAALSPAAAARQRPALAMGQRSPAVVYVQQKLGVRPASGYYGALTSRAVRSLQKANGLRATGRVDAATWQVLLAASTEDASAAAATAPQAAAQQRPALALGSRSPAVVHVQRTLGVTPASGYFGELTRSAVQALQRARGLAVTGTVDDPTWDVLLAADGVIALPPGSASSEQASGAGAGESGSAPSATPSPAPSDDPGTAADPAAPAPPAPVALTPEQAAAARPVLRAGMGPGDPAVIHVQQFLRVSPATGYFGSLTKAAVKAYQKGLGIKATGTVGPATWDAIAAGRMPAPADPSAPAGTAAPTDPAAPATRTDPAASTPAPSTSTPPATPIRGTIATPTYVLPENPAAREVALVFALAQVGKPYVLGGNGPEVFDCSGLVQQAYLAAGVRLPRLASQQRFAGTKVTLEELLPGDLLYYQDGSSPRRGHISMYAGDGLVVEAANPRRGVRIRTLHEAWYRDRFVAAVRIG
jgi:cell wall-associated NlpC family hydrolase